MKLVEDLSSYLGSGVFCSELSPLDGFQIGSTTVLFLLGGEGKPPCPCVASATEWQVAKQGPSQGCLWEGGVPSTLWEVTSPSPGPSHTCLEHGPSLDPWIPGEAICSLDLASLGPVSWLQPSRRWNPPLAVGFCEQHQAWCSIIFLVKVSSIHYTSLPSPQILIANHGSHFFTHFGKGWTTHNKKRWAHRMSPLFLTSCFLRRNA